MVYGFVFFGVGGVRPDGTSVRCKTVKLSVVHRSRHTPSYSHVCSTSTPEGPFRDEEVVWYLSVETILRCLTLVGVFGVPKSCRRSHTVLSGLSYAFSTLRSVHTGPPTRLPTPRLLDSLCLPPVSKVLPHVPLHLLVPLDSNTDLNRLMPGTRFGPGVDKNVYVARTLCQYK